MMWGDGEPIRGQVGVKDIDAQTAAIQKLSSSMDAIGAMGGHEKMLAEVLAEILESRKSPRLEQAIRLVMS